MKRKAILCLLLAAMTLFSAATAHADLFPGLSPLSTATPAPQAAEAPSYGAYANVDYAETWPYGESGQTVYAYENVTEENFMAFGNYLEERGFQATASEVEGTNVQTIITDGRFSIGVIYYGDERKLMMIYEKDVVPAEKDFFSGYSRVGLNEQIRIPNLGKFTFEEFEMNVENKAGFNRRSEGINSGKIFIDAYLKFSFLNTTEDNLYYSSDKPDMKENNTLFDVKVLYINENGVEEYPTIVYGPKRVYEDDPSLLFCYGWSVFNMQLTKDGLSSHPYRSIEAYSGFDLPESLFTSTDGTLALLLDFKTGDKYYIPIREDGVAVK